MTNVQQQQQQVNLLYDDDDQDEFIEYNDLWEHDRKKEKIIKMVDSLEEIQQMHEDLHELVLEQQENIDQLQQNVHITKDEVKEAADHIEEAERFQRGNFLGGFGKGAKKEAKPPRLSLHGLVRQAYKELEKYVRPSKLTNDDAIPRAILRKAKGIVFLTVVKAGFLLAGNVGTGIVLVRKEDGNWSGASAIGLTGVSAGILVGASKVDYIIVLRSIRAVDQFKSTGQLRIGGELQLTAGPLGRDAHGSIGIGNKGASALLSYSHSKGLFGGVALDGQIIFVRHDCNKFYYNKDVSSEDILSGKTQQPQDEYYEKLIDLLNEYCKYDSNEKKEDSKDDSNEQEKKFDH